jgi:molybdopterin-guanine dinucleotide biosynthesis protein B
VKVVGIAGYKKSGKTTLGLRLCNVLSEMGYRVGVLKHAGEIDFPDSDSAKYKEFASTVSVVSSQEAEIILKGEKSIEEMLAYFDADVVLVEGFKKEKTFPKIFCLTKEEDRNELFDGLGICTASLGGAFSDFDILKEAHIRKMASMALESGFKLPGLNCTQCGYESCYELAREIVGGREPVERCVSLNPPISVKVDGKPFPLNDYTSSLFRNLIVVMVSSLKGYKKGSIEIEIPRSQA